MRDEEKEEKDEYYRRETSSGSFTRTVVLPSEVDATKFKAKFEDGVLEMTLPKRPIYCGITRFERGKFGAGLAGSRDADR